jgi:hypothetical protein
MKISIFLLSISIQFLINFEHLACLPVQTNLQNQMIANQLDFVVNQEANVLKMLQNLRDIFHKKAYDDYYYDYDAYYDEDNQVDSVYNNDYDIYDKQDSSIVF